jgi:hypothetical protein
MSNATNVIDLHTHRQRRAAPIEPSEEDRWWEDMAAFVLENAKPVLNKREMIFLADMLVWPRAPSQKQAAWLEALHIRAGMYVEGKAEQGKSKQTNDEPPNDAA